MKKLCSRLLPAVLGMVVLSATTAFAQVNADAKAVYDDMEAKSKLMSDANMSIQMDMLMSDGTDTMQMKMDMNMLCNNMNDPANMQYLSKATMNVGEEAMEALIWLKDGYSYTDVGGQKIKTKSDYNQAMTAAMTMPEMQGPSSQLFSELNLTVDGDKRYLNYKMDDETMNAYVKKIFDSMGFESLLSSMNMQFKIYDIKGTYTLTPDNLYESATISMAMDISAEGETISINVNGIINMLNVGQPVQIEFPDPSGYIDPTEVPAA